MDAADRRNYGACVSNIFYRRECVLMGGGSCGWNYISAGQQMDEGSAGICGQYDDSSAGSISWNMGTPCSVGNSISSVRAGGNGLSGIQPLVKEKDDAISSFSGSSIPDCMDYSRDKMIYCNAGKISKRYRASMTIETAYLMPLFFLMFILIMRMAFYFHDKTVLYGTAYETAAKGVEISRQNNSDNFSLDDYFQKRLGRKMIYFGRASKEITVNEEAVIVEAEASRRRMSISVRVTMPVTEPERKIRKIQGLKNTIGKKSMQTESGEE